VTVEEFRASGYLPEALVNFLALLGWSYDDRTTIMSRDELVERFSLERVGASPATFDYAKLDWMNGVYIRSLPPEEFADRLVAYMRERGIEWEETLVRRAAPLVQEKIETLGRFPEFARFLFEPVGAVDGFDTAGREMLAAAARSLAEVDPFEAEPIERALRSTADELGLKPRQAFQPVRVAVTGSTVSLGLFESLELLGREVALERIRRAAGAGA
jgi:glutamyl-tRNA synthetase